MANASGSKIGTYQIYAYTSYSVSSTATQTKLTVTSAVTKCDLPNVGLNDISGSYSVTDSSQNTKIATGKQMRSSGDVTMFSSFTWTWDKGTSASTKTVKFSITWSGSTSTAQFTVPVDALASYTIKYNGNNATSGTTPSNQTKYYGKTLTLKTNPFSRTGYTFSNWNTNSTGSGSSYISGGSYIKNEAATMYAQWTPVSYTVTLNANGGVSGSPTSISRTYGSSFTIPETSIPTRSSYKFLGWAESDTATTPTYIHTGETTGTCTISSYNAVTGNKTLYAVWEVAYIKPKITSPTAYRVDSPTSSSQTNEGTYIYVTFGYTKGSINGSYRATDYKITIDGTQVTSGSLSSDIGTIPTSTVAYGGSYGTSTSHTVVVTLSDNQEPSYEKAESTVIVASAIYPIDLIGSNNGVYMGLMHPAVSEQILTMPSGVIIDGNGWGTKQYGDTYGNALGHRVTLNDTINSKSADMCFAVGGNGIDHGIYDYTNDRWMIYAGNGTNTYVKNLHNVGDVYITDTNNNPQSYLGGTWELIEKSFIYGSGTSGATWNTTNTTNGAIAWTREGHNIWVRLYWKNKVALSDNDQTICTLDTTVMGGKSTMSVYSVYPLGYCDGQNAILMGEVTWSDSTATVKLVDVTTRATSIPTGTGTDCHMEFVFRLASGYMSDSACNKFYWHRTA